MADNEVLTTEELDHLSEIREVCNTANTAGWHRILKQMRTWVDEAQEDMIGAGYAAAEIKAGLQTRWQQRVSMLRGVEKYVNACLDEKKLLVQMSAQRSVPTEEYAQQDREVA